MPSSTGLRVRRSSSVVVMLRIVFRNRHRNLPKAEGLGSGPQGRINKMRKLVSALIRHERIEGYAHYLDESRGYAELLILEAMKHGDQHRPTMELADYWLLEKDLIHKLFKVIVPRYSGFQTSYTQFYDLPSVYPGRPMRMGLLELKGNPWPPVLPHVRDLSGTLVNVLLREAKKDYHNEMKSKETESFQQTKLSGSDAKNNVDSDSKLTAEGKDLSS